MTGGGGREAASGGSSDTFARTFLCTDLYCNCVCCVQLSSLSFTRRENVQRPCDGTKTRWRPDEKHSLSRSVSIAIDLWWADMTVMRRDPPFCNCSYRRHNVLLAAVQRDCDVQCIHYRFLQCMEGVVRWPFSFINFLQPLVPCRVTWGLSQLTLGGRRGSPWISHQFISGLKDKQPFTHKWMPIRSICSHQFTSTLCFLVVGGNPGRRGENMQSPQRKVPGVSTKGHRSSGRFKPRTFSLWAKRQPATYWTVRLRSTCTWL